MYEHVVCEFLFLFVFFCKFCEDLMFKCFVYKVKNMYILVNQIVQESLYFG